MKVEIANAADLCRFTDMGNSISCEVLVDDKRISGAVGYVLSKVLGSKFSY